MQESKRREKKCVTYVINTKLKMLGIDLVLNCPYYQIGRDKMLQDISEIDDGSGQLLAD